MPGCSIVYMIRCQGDERMQTNRMRVQVSRDKFSAFFGCGIPTVDFPIPPHSRRFTPSFQIDMSGYRII